MIITDLVTAMEIEGRAPGSLRKLDEGPIVFAIGGRTPENRLRQLKLASALGRKAYVHFLHDDYNYAGSLSAVANEWRNRTAEAVIVAATRLMGDAKTVGNAFGIEVIPAQRWVANAQTARSRVKPEWRIQAIASAERALDATEDEMAHELRLKYVQVAAALDDAMTYAMAAIEAARHAWEAEDPRHYAVMAAGCAYAAESTIAVAVSAAMTREAREAESDS